MHYPWHRSGQIFYSFFYGFLFFIPLSAPAALPYLQPAHIKQNTELCNSATGDVNPAIIKIIQGNYSKASREIRNLQRFFIEGDKSFQGAIEHARYACANIKRGEDFFNQTTIVMNSHDGGRDQAASCAKVSNMYALAGQNLLQSRTELRAGYQRIQYDKAEQRISSKAQTPLEALCKTANDYIAKVQDGEKAAEKERLGFFCNNVTNYSLLLRDKAAAMNEEMKKFQAAAKSLKDCQDQLSSFVQSYSDPAHISLVDPEKKVFADTAQIDRASARLAAGDAAAGIVKAEAVNTNASPEKEFTIPMEQISKVKGVADPDQVATFLKQYNAKIYPLNDTSQGYALQLTDPDKQNNITYQKITEAEKKSILDKLGIDNKISETEIDKILKVSGAEAMSNSEQVRVPATNITPIDLPDGVSADTTDASLIYNKISDANRKALENAYGCYFLLDDGSCRGGIDTYLLKVVGGKIVLEKQIL